jgi:hypothetical protein
MKWYHKLRFHSGMTSVHLSLRSVRFGNLEQTQHNHVSCQNSVRWLSINRGECTELNTNFSEKENHYTEKKLTESRLFTWVHIS